MIVVDSSVWIDYFNGVKSWQTDTLDDVLGRQRIVVGDLILAEVLQGFKQDKDYHVAKFLLESLEFQAMLGKQIAIQSADNYRLQGFIDSWQQVLQSKRHQVVFVTPPRRNMVEPVSKRKLAAYQALAPN